MFYSKKILICGGDKRQKYLYRQMLLDGFDIGTYAIGEENPAIIDDFWKFDVVIFPVPVTRDGVHLNAPMLDYSIKLNDIFAVLSPSQTVLGGITDKLNYDMIDYYKSEKLQMKNSIPTAEGAINIAMQNIETTIYGSKCLVMGFGRTAKVLCDRLLKLGAYVSVAARSEKDLALSEIYGFTPINIKYLSDYISDFDIIFNTIPAVVVDNEIMGKINKNTLIIDLAGKPYGFDLDSAKAWNKNIITAPGLPGKYSPISSAKILKEVISELLIEMEV
ncbi:MAG: hypothetical protein IJQ28_06260 [Clostridia bacterium]|nr:hypothetical protein [Clostridia bacterium]